MNNKRKDEIIKSIIDMVRMHDRQYISIVLTDEESKMTLNELKVHLLNEEVKNNNNRCDEILKVNEID